MKQGEQFASQLEATGLNMEEYCACATEGLAASDAINQEEMANRAQQCISDAMAQQAS